MRRFLAEQFSVGSRQLNVILGGSADMTFSARVHMDGWRRTEALIDWVFWVIIGEVNHCEIWFHEDIRRAQALVVHVQHLVKETEQPADGVPTCR